VSTLLCFHSETETSFTQMTLGLGSFTKDDPDFAMNIQTDLQTDRHTHTHTHTHTHHLGPSYPKRAEERNQGLAHLLFSPSLPPSLHLLFFITRCLFKQTARTDMANILKSFSKSSCKSQANLYRETEAFWFWVEIIKFFLCYFQQTQMSLRDLCCGGYCPSILC